MNGQGGQKETSGTLPSLHLWALSLGCAVGWGCFVMPGNTFLPLAGAVGTTVGMVVSALIMAVIAINYGYLIREYPGNGGTYTYTAKILGYDHAFLSAWSLGIAYLTVLWANASSVALIGRYFFGDLLQFGFHYRFAGYDIWFGEVLTTELILIAYAFATIYLRRSIHVVYTILAVIMVAAALILFAAAAASGKGNFSAPPFAEGSPRGVQVLNIVMMAPWAFVGYEVVTHTAGRYSGKVKRPILILVAGAVAAAVIYTLHTLICALTFPAGVSNWQEYMSLLEKRKGINALPLFGGVRSMIGEWGFILLLVAVFAAISTSLLGLYRAIANLMSALSEDGIFPEKLAQRDKNGVPRKLIALIAIVSLGIPFFGRTAIGWITDITTISASIAYCYASVCAAKKARQEGRRLVLVTGYIGAAISVLFFFFPLVPNLLSQSALPSESYLILAAWSMLGLIFYRILFRKDHKHRFGHATVMWILMLFLIFFSSTMWMREKTKDQMTDSIGEIEGYYTQEMEEQGIPIDAERETEETATLRAQMDLIGDGLLRNSLIQMILILISLAIMFNIFSIMRRREKEMDRKRAQAEENSRAKSIFLSNMSHDIRTPMNAILGYTRLALGPETTAEDMRDYLTKIDASGKHLLALINDVLEMSRIENGRIELEECEVDLVRLVTDAGILFEQQMKDKGIHFVTDCRDVTDSLVFCDINRLNRVLLNLVSNAYKFTPEGGTVTLALSQKGPEADGRAEYEILVRDTGIGMSSEFAERVFDAFERERTSTVSGIQGTGLGMAITRNLVELMNGTIEVASEPGKGTAFTITLMLRKAGSMPQDNASAAEGSAVPDEQEQTAAAAETDRFSGVKVLLVDDIDVNRELARRILTKLGFEVRTAVNGREAVDAVKGSDRSELDLVLMDVQMPVMNGLDAARAIRAFDDPSLASIPIIAMTANAFAEDVQAVMDAGMNAHIAKPIDIQAMKKTIGEVLDAADGIVEI